MGIGDILKMSDVISLGIVEVTCATYQATTKGCLGLKVTQHKQNDE